MTLKNPPFLKLDFPVKFKRRGTANRTTDAQPLFDNLVERTKDLQSICALLTLTITVISSGCALNRVSVKTQFHGIPLEIELSNGSDSVSTCVDCKSNSRSL